MKEIIKKRIIIILFLLIGINSCSYALGIPSIKDSIISYFNYFQMIPQDKLYLHLDKPYYGAGESIWYKGYLLSAVTHKDDRRSNFITVELISRKDTIIESQKIRRENGIFQGKFSLTADLPAGEYYIRAYSNWMLNEDAAFFYNRKIKIGNAIDTSPAIKEKKKKQRVSSDYSVTFFPEGGDLLNLPNQIQIVAFKVQGSDGLSKKARGLILNEKNDTLAFIQTLHNGMGYFPITTKEGEHYHAEVISDNEVSKRFELPAVQTQGIKLTMGSHKGLFLYKILKTANIVWPDSLYLVAHTRGRLQIIKHLTPSDTIGRFNESLFEDGITHFLLIDGKGMPLSERLIFIYHRNQPKWTVTTDHPSYDKREKVGMHIALADEMGNPLSGNFSISVTDNSVVNIDPQNENILSNLLLTSDLKGYIETPGFYFQDHTPITEECINLLMLTHGWRRFDIKNILEKPHINTTNYIEVGQSIGGKIKGLLGNKVKNAPVVALCLKRKLLLSTLTNDKGEFLFDGISFPDSTSFVIQARTKHGFAGVDVLIDNPNVPTPKCISPFTDDSLKSINNYLLAVRDEYFNTGGMHVIKLKNIVVTAKRKVVPPPSPQNEIYTSMPDYTISGDEITNMGGMSIYDLLQRMPGVLVSSDHHISIRGSKYQPAMIIDGIYYDNEMDESLLSSISLNEIERVDLIKGAGASIFGMRGSGGGIVISLKSGVNVNATKTSAGLVTISPKGYSNSVHFYEPVYVTSEQKNTATPDLRTTIYWNPALKLDATGTANVEFYTNDKKTSQHVIIEGITTEGRVCRYSKDF